MSDGAPYIPEPDSRRWLAAPADQLDWAEWDGEYVLFHRLSGQTHFVNAATARLLQSVLTEPRTVDEAISVLASQARPDEFAELRERISEQLLLLEDLGLVSLHDSPH